MLIYICGNAVLEALELLLPVFLEKLFEALVVPDDAARASM